jgi:NAD-dependent DNA ligase
MNVQMNLREQKYQPLYLVKYCPACGLEVSRGEWGDYGMHLRCTEYYQAKKQRSEQYHLFEETESHNFFLDRVG